MVFRIFSEDHEFKTAILTTTNFLARRNKSIWYIVFTVAGTNKVMGLTRNCVVTSFTRMPESEFIEYIDKMVIPLILRSKELG